jgi:hypothetical protein
MNQREFILNLMLIKFKQSVYCSLLTVKLMYVQWFAPLWCCYCTGLVDWSTSGVKNGAPVHFHASTREPVLPKHRSPTPASRVLTWGPMQPEHHSCRASTWGPLAPLPASHTHPCTTPDLLLKHSDATLATYKKDI